MYKNVKCKNICTTTTLHILTYHLMLILILHVYLKKKAGIGTHSNLHTGSQYEISTFRDV